MKRPQLVSAGTLNRILKAAEEAWSQKDYERCIENLERASRLNPANVAILAQLGRAYGLRYDYASAERCFEKAIRVAPKKSEALAAVARHSIDFANHHLCERYFRLAVEQKDVSADTLATMAEFQERLHRLDEASVMTDRALKLDAHCGPALLTRARLERRAGRLEQAEKLLRSFVPGSDRETQVPGWYEFGAVLDRQGRYDEAMAAFLEAKALMRTEAPPHLAQSKEIRAGLRVMQDQFFAELLQRWFGAGQVLQPPRRLAFLGGHARSGTTLLEQVLDSHPDIVSADETSLFFDNVFKPLRRGLLAGAFMISTLESAPTDVLQKGREHYYRLMELHVGSPIAGRLLIDKNPNFNHLIAAFLRFFPEMRVLVALRDPRDVCLSCFMQGYTELSTATANFLSLGGTAEEYAFKMGLWKALAPCIENHYLEVRYEDMVADLESVARKTLDFLGVAWDARVLGFDEHARKKIVRSPTYADVTQPVYKRAVGRWRNYQKYFEPHLETLAPLVKAFGYE